MRALFGLFRFLKGSWSPMIWALVFTLAATGLNLIQPKLLEWAVDFGVAGEDVRLVLLGGLGILVAGVVSGALHMGSGVLLVRSGQTLGVRLRGALFRKTQSFSFGNLDSWRTGELLVRVNSDVETVRRFMRMGLLLMVQSVVMLVGALILMFATNVELGSVMVIVLPGMLALFLILAAIIRPMMRRVRERLDELNNVLQENLAGAKVVRAFARQSYETSRFEQRNRAFMSTSMRVGYIMSIAFPFLFFLGQLAIVLATWLGGLQVIEGLLNPAARDLTLGQLLAFNNYALQTMWPILALGMVMQFLTRAVASAERIEELLTVSPTIDGEAEAIRLEPEMPEPRPDSPSTPAGVSAVRPLRGDIEFRGVSFSFGEAANALDRVSLEVSAGETLGILGRTGSGKSTLAYLVPRFYDPVHGSVLVDGTDVRELDLRRLRRRATLVLQESVLMSGTILDNIAFARPDLRAGLGRVEEGERLPSEQVSPELVRAAEIARALEFIEEKDGAWLEPVGERGTGLSGGQRQRIAIARALVNQPDILILDDVTSSLDAQTERELVANLKRELSGKTVMAISQKVNTVMHADRVIVLEEGRIEAEGTHESLLESSPVYREMHETQTMEIRA
jgi:ATP-binding cassette subfamily B protein